MRRGPGGGSATPVTFGAGAVPRTGLPTITDWLGSMLNDGGVRVSHTTASNRRYTAADLAPQLFLLPPAYPNDNLATAAQSAGVSRNQLNRRRGSGAH